MAAGTDPLRSAPRLALPANAEGVLTGAAPLILLLLFWQLMSALGVVSAQVLPPPSEVAQTLWVLARSGELGLHVGESLGRLTAGFAIGAAAGIGFGTLLALSRKADLLLAPTFLGIRQVPVLALVPMLALLLGVGEVFKITIVAVSTFFPVAIATVDGVRAIPRGWLDVASIFRLPLPVTLYRILLPATVPAVLTGLRIALTRAWMMVVLAELLAADSGVGQMMEMGRQLFRIDTVLAGVVVSGLIGFLLDRGAKAIERRAMRWKTA